MDEFQFDQVKILKLQHPNDYTPILQYISRFTVKTIDSVFHRKSPRERWIPITMTALKLICGTDKTIMALWKDKSPIVAVIIDPESTDVVDKDGNYLKINIWFNTFPQTPPPPFSLETAITPWLNHIKTSWCNNDDHSFKIALQYFGLLFQHPNKRSFHVILRNPTNNPNIISSIMYPISKLLGPNYVSLVGQKNITLYATQNNNWAQALVLHVKEPLSKSEMEIFDNDSIAVKYKGFKPFHVQNIIHSFIESNAFVIGQTKTPCVEFRCKFLNDHPVSQHYYDDIRSISSDCLYHFFKTQKI